ncbi:MAG: hypothetical protein FWE14_02915 [Lachnospiraceae bacterium]|nr:hypothetical protein [Lachnospiraceae bacterium]
MKKYLETGLMILCAAGFFGFIYPELCLTKDTVKVIEIEATKEECQIEKNGHDLIKAIYNERLSLTPAQIRLRFRLFEAAGNK